MHPRGQLKRGLRDAMAIKKQMCSSHPDRPAIGLCVETREPICAECSTRYEGVNYSKEGLRIMQARRKAPEKAKGRGAWRVLAVLSVPVLLLLLYGFYYYTADQVTQVLHMSLEHL